VTSHNTGTAARAVVDNVTVKAAGSGTNRPPTVSLSAPASGASYTAPATITLGAAATDPDGPVTRVEFFRNGTLIGSDTSAPFAATWSAAPAGTYALTAVAYDADGASASSAAVNVTVTGTTTSAPRYVVFEPSADHSNGVTSYLMEIFAAGANPSTATPIATSDLGKPAAASSGDITVDRAAVFSALAPGNYVATVSAIGPGGRTRSTAVTFSR
jgi:hypothetical protein